MSGEQQGREEPCICPMHTWCPRHGRVVPFGVAPSSTPPARDSGRDEAREAVARLFHDTYERLAPQYGYRTRQESAVPWEHVPEANRALMVATVGALLPELVALLRDGEQR